MKKKSNYGLKFFENGYSLSSGTSHHGWMNFRTPTTEIGAAVLFHTVNSTTAVWSRTVLLLFSIRILKNQFCIGTHKSCRGKVRFPKWYVSCNDIVLQLLAWYFPLFQNVVGFSDHMQNYSSTAGCALKRWNLFNYVLLKRNCGYNTL